MTSEQILAQLVRYPVFCRPCSRPVDRIISQPVQWLQATRFILEHHGAIEIRDLTDDQLTRLTLPGIVARIFARPAFENERPDEIARRLAWKLRQQLQVTVKEEWLTDDVYFNNDERITRALDRYENGEGVSEEDQNLLRQVPKTRYERAIQTRMQRLNQRFEPLREFETDRIIGLSDQMTGASSAFVWNQNQTTQAWNPFIPPAPQDARFENISPKKPATPRPNLATEIAPGRRKLSLG